MRVSSVRGLVLFVGLTCLSASPVRSQATATRTTAPSGPAPFSTKAEKCIIPAATYHSVNYYLLRALLKVESGLNPGAVNRNSNGSIDVGLGQHNSIHFGELAKFGLAPQHLLDACVSTYVAAWELKKSIDRFGNTWEGIAHYHSATPYNNQRYQILLRNELIRMGALIGAIQPVPPLRTAIPLTKVATTAPPGIRFAKASSMIVDSQ